MYNLKIKGDPMPVDIESLAMVNDMSVLEVEEILSKNIGNIISIGIIDDIVVKLDKPCKAPVRVIDKPLKVVKKNSKTRKEKSTKKLHDIEVIEYNLHIKGYGCKHYLDGKRMDLSKIAFKLGYNYQYFSSLIACVTKAKIGSHVFEREINKDMFKVALCVSDGVNIYENMTFKDISDKYGIKMSYIYKTFRTWKAFVTKEILISCIPFDEAINYIRYIGQDSERYYFGDTIQLHDRMGYKCSIHTIRNTITKFGYYQEGDKIIIRNRRINK